MAASEYFFSSPLANYEPFQTYASFENQIGLIKNLNTLHDDISGSIVTYETKKMTWSEIIKISVRIPSSTQHEYGWTKRIDCRMFPMASKKTFIL